MSFGGLSEGLPSLVDAGRWGLKVFVVRKWK